MWGKFAVEEQIAFDDGFRFGFRSISAQKLLHLVSWRLFPPRSSVGGADFFTRFLAFLLWLCLQLQLLPAATLQRMLLHLLPLSTQREGEKTRTSCSDPRSRQRTPHAEDALVALSTPRRHATISAAWTTRAVET